MVSGIDGLTVVNKPYGRIGLPIAPDGGVEESSPLVLKDYYSGSRRRGAPPVYVNGTQVRPENLSIYAAATKQDKFVQVEFIMQLNQEGGGWESIAGAALTGALTVGLPYESSTAFFGGFSWIYPFAAPGFRRFVVPNSLTTVKFVHHDNTSATLATPTTFNLTTLLQFELEYFADVDADWLWQ